MPIRALIYYSLACLVCAQAASSGSGEELSPNPLGVSTESVDFGTISAHKIHHKSVTIRNTSNRVVEIEPPESSCPCTEVSVDRLLIGPGKEVTLTIELDLSDYPSNQVRSTVSVSAKAPPNWTATVQVTADILPEFNVVPPVVDFGKVKLKSTPATSIKLTLGESKDVRIVRVVSDSGLSAKICNDGCRVIDIALTSPESAGPFSGKVTVTTDAQRMAVFDIPVSAQFVGVEYKVSPRVLLFTAEAGATGRAGHVQVESESEFQISDVSTTIPGVAGEVETIRPNRSYRIHAVPAKVATQGEKRGNLQFRVREGDLIETVSVSILGTIRP